MREFHKMLDVSQEKPSDWVPDPRIVNEEEGPAKILTSFTPEEKHLIFKRRILMLLPKKGPHRRNRQMPEEEEKKSVFWLIKNQESKILGPFTGSEMEEKIKEGELVGLEIKRDDDKEFVCYDSLSKVVANPLDIQEYEKFIRENETKEEEDKPSKSPITGSRYDILFVDDSKAKDESLYKNFVKDFRTSLAEKKNVFQMDNCTFLKSREFLKKRNCHIEIQSIVQKIYGKTKANATNIICLLTMMNKEDCESLLNLITSESMRELLSDNNPDGFVKVLKKHTRR